MQEKMFKEMFLLKGNVQGCKFLNAEMFKSLKEMFKIGSIQMQEMSLKEMLQIAGNV